MEIAAFVECLLACSSSPLITGINVLCWQWFQPHPRVSVVLYEDHVPDLNHHGVIHVHQASSVTPADAIVVDLAARTLVRFEVVL